jgi:hypothetical protein
MPAADDAVPPQGTEPTDDDLHRLADLAVAAVEGRLDPGAVDPDDRMARRVAHVVDAVRRAGS